jgi:hypothetical protein
MGLLSRWFGPPTQESFAKLVERARRDAGDARACTFDADQFCLRFGGAGELQETIYLSNAYRDYCDAGRSERPEVLRAYAAMSAGRDPFAEEDALSFEAARPTLLPRVREASYWTAFDLNTRAQQAASPKPTDKPPLDNFVLRPLADGLVVEVVRDEPTQIVSAGRSLLDRWGVPFADVMAAARDNLWKLSNADWVQVRPGLFASPWRDTHDASRLALHGLIWQLPVRGRHVAAVPNRNVLLVTGDEDGDNLIAMAALVAQVLTEPRPMTGTAFRLDGTAWHPFLPPADSPAHWPLRLVAMESTARDYAEQAGLLDALHAATQQDVFVAKHSLRQRPDQTLLTNTTWADGVGNALMPAADFVFFGGSVDGQRVAHGFAPWDRVMTVAGHRTEPTDLYPPRWRVRSFPTPDELTAMQLAEQLT